MIFLASFLVLFLEVALIRWMPSYIRLLSFFSNFILLASFLGIGVGCLLASSRRRLFYLFPILQLLVIGAVFAEWAGSSEGLGHLIQVSSGELSTDLTFAAITVLSAMAIALYGALALVERLVVNWREEPAR
jgi:hypothetical protein